MARTIDTEYFRRKLLEEQEHLQQEDQKYNQRNSIGATDELGDLADYDNHPADAASETYDRERDLASHLNTRALLERVEVALRKLAENSYGICDRCGIEIPLERLEVEPYASLCIRCQEIIEGE